MKSSFIIKSKDNNLFKKRLVLTEKPAILKVPGQDKKIYLKIDNNRVKWSHNGKRYLVGMNKCPVIVDEVTYPKISMLPLSRTTKNQKDLYGHQYFLVNRKTGQIILSKFSPKKMSLNEKTATKFFKTPVIKRFHDIKTNPVFSKEDIAFEKDPYSHEYGALIRDERIKKTTTALLLLWFLMLGYNHFLKTDKKEVTLIQVENKEKLLKERKTITNLLSVKGKDKVNKRTSKKIKKVISKKTSRKSSPKKSKIKKVTKNSSVKNKTKRKLLKGKNNVASNIKSVKKSSPKPSLQDQLFSRTLKKGRIGAASDTASKTLRGSTSGSSKGKNYGSSSKIQGGFSNGTGSSLGARLNKRGGSIGNGDGVGAGGNGVGSLGSRVLLSGNGANISGGLTREQIAKVVRRNKKDINRCYESRLQFSPGMAGKVTMAFSINAAGRVITSSAHRSTIRDAALQNCMAKKIKKWRFDQPVNGRVVQVTFPFNLSYGKGSI